MKASGNRNGDITDSAKDKKRLQPEEASLDLPGVKDIPGQEFIHPPAMGELADTTIASDDEEGRGVLEDDGDNETQIRMGTESDVPKDEQDLLSQRIPSEDDKRLRQAAPDDRDNEGELLNERSGDTRRGSDPDTSGIDEDDRNEAIGEEDEENNAYSLGGDEREADDDNGTIGIP
jgi:hypothetical protein